MMSIIAKRILKLIQEEYSFYRFTPLKCSKFKPVAEFLKERNIQHEYIVLGDFEYDFLIKIDDETLLDLLLLIQRRITVSM